jgi:hypothetical protein
MSIDVKSLLAVIAYLQAPLTQGIATRGQALPFP